MDQYTQALIVFIVVFIITLLIANRYLNTFASVTLALIVGQIIGSLFIPKSIVDFFNPSASMKIYALIMFISWIIILVYLFSAIFSDVRKKHTCAY